MTLDFYAFADAELFALIESDKKEVARALKAWSSSGTSTTKEDYDIVVARYNAAVSEARRRGLALPGIVRQRVWCTAGRAISSNF